MKKILVVDDDVDILALVQMMLTMHNFNVDAISRWEKIPESLENFEPDLILLDISLVGADGRVICKQLKQSNDTSHIPVILFSANAEMGSNYLEYQAEDFIAKPFEMSHLIGTIRHHVN
ncbi:MAG TPA: response regulator [Chitinophagaceae bacterium]|nr:response regulator [Chitinophagaceae bacterium]